MNKIFKVIWNPATGSYSVASETAKSRGKKSGRSKLLISALVAGGYCRRLGPAQETSGVLALIQLVLWVICGLPSVKALKHQQMCLTHHLLQLVHMLRLWSQERQLLAITVLQAIGR